jgi:hypothetical protein
MKPNIIVRRGNKFIIDESKILPYMRKNKDLIILAVSNACQELKQFPASFNPNSVCKLQELNDRVYELLKEWKVYKD